MTRSFPAITLLIPCHNAARFLPRILAEARAQTRPFAAILAYDDGSTDDTAAAAAALGLPLIGGKENRGVSVARNRLAAAVQTEWLHCHDADDLIDPHFVEKLGLLLGPDIDVASCDAQWLDAASLALQIEWRYSPRALAADPAAYLIEHPMSLNNTVIRTAAWRQAGGCDESLRMWEDADLHLRLGVQGARWAHLPEVLTSALRRPESFSHNYRESWACRLTALEGYARRLSARYGPLLATEAERAAAELLYWGDRTGAQRAVRLCRSLGGDPPTITHPAGRALKRLVPALTLIRWQLARRRPK